MSSSLAVCRGLLYDALGFMCDIEPVLSELPVTDHMRVAQTWDNTPCIVAFWYTGSHTPVCAEFTRKGVHWRIDRYRVAADGTFSAPDGTAGDDVQSLRSVLQRLERKRTA